MKSTNGNDGSEKNDPLANVEGVDRERLKVDKKYRLAGLVQGIDESTAGLVRAAIHLKAMEEAGDEIPKELGPKLLGGLRRIGKGTMLLEAFAQFRWNWRLMRRIGNYPLAEQRRLSHGGAIDMVVVGDDGKFSTTRMMVPSAMDTDQLRQVFGPDGVRTRVEQIAWLERRRTDEAVTRQEEEGEYVIDAKRRCIKVLKAEVILTEEIMARALHQFAIQR